MGRPVLLLGKSGSGKSSSLRNIGKCLLINVLKKPLPFKENANITNYNSSDFLQIKNCIRAAQDKDFKTIIIDDSGYLLTEKFMAGHRGAKGNSLFDLYNELADNFYNLIMFVINEVKEDVNVYFVMQESVDDFGNIKPKTIGKLLDDKICVEGLFTIVLHAIKRDGRYVFATTTDGNDVTKSPMGMFKDEYIDNDLVIVDKAIRDYYTTPKGDKPNA